MYDKKTLQAVARAIGKKIKLSSAKARNENLDVFCADFAEAYEVGVEEAQQELLARIGDLMKEAS